MTSLRQTYRELAAEVAVLLEAIVDAICGQDITPEPATLPNPRGVVIWALMGPPGGGVASSRSRASVGSRAKLYGA